MACDPSGPVRVRVYSQARVLAERGGGALFENGPECLAPYAGRVENGTGPAHRGLLGADQPGPGAVPMEVWD